MLSRKTLRWAIGATLVAGLLVGCGSSAVKPQAGAIFSGTLELVHSGSDNASLGGGELEITITDDGTGIASATFTLSNMRCSNESGSISMTSEGSSSTTRFVQPAEIVNGRFELDIGGRDEDITIEGEFTSPTGANATIEISTSSTVAPPGTSFRETINCDYGSWSWSGRVQ